MPALVLLLAACARPPATPRDGQWIWTPDDAAVLREARAVQPSFGAGVRVASITYDTVAHAPRLTLGAPPSAAGRDTVAAVIRLEQSFDAGWRQEQDTLLARQLGERFDSLLQVLARQPVIISELQLDYDVPVRLLPRWSRVLATLTAGPLAGREVWVTSIVSHLRAAGYASGLRGHVAGHILQVFDTGERADDRAMREVVELLDDADLPFRLGVGAFERRLSNGRTTEHRRWFTLVPRLRQHADWRGLWIFPAGARWTSLLGGPA